jgi:hypothetical protein
MHTNRKSRIAKRHGDPIQLSPGDVIAIQKLYKRNGTETKRAIAISVDKTSFF